MAQRTSRWWTKLVGVLVVLVLLAGAGELALRLIIPGIVQGAIRTQLHLTDDHPVDVSLGGSALLAALGGGVGDVTVEVPNAPLLEGVEADATVHAARVPFSPTTGEITGGTAQLRVSKEQLGNVIELVTQGLAQTGTVRDGSLVVGRSVDLFGQSIELSASIGLSVVDGQVEIEPRGVQAAGLDLSAEQISAATGSLLDPILSPQALCVDDRLPRGVELTGIDLSSTGSATISADLAPGILSDPAEQELGSCG
ncbi:DUF2993 domain-containing protein [Leucobacter allii]|uniref:DUF2993 domain-containing protein n=1 Tax=Leucobacter allii TaxID=2932247 RepID=A0ABY4FHH6_9MICO|nr:DUF2993 domain-containing protein [Leucobacter allii]UOQ56137.1 DUF2993 domain-containing protein [Leucobacter allii]UOR00606.1 DUF2993 domain-containing protein [Leucobacter allii]